jgi:2-dehydropantoate 2-reductase
VCKGEQVRFVVIGAGAVGGVVGARLHQNGHDVVLVARGAHYDAIRAGGLQLRAPEEAVTLPLPVYDRPDAVPFAEGDVVLLCVKSQDTVSVLSALEGVAPPPTPIACMQNGVANERAALRVFDNVQAVCVMLPAVHLDPGVVEANAAPITGILDVGRVPGRVDDTTIELSEALAASTFVSEPRADIMRWKYGKLLNNLGNAIDALAGRDARRSDLAARARAEGEAALRAAGIDVITREEDAARRGDILPWGGAAASARGGSSSWQSLARGTGAIEADYLNGEIALLGRLHGVPTPVNTTLQRLANQAAREGAAPASWSVDDVIREVERGE